MEKRALGKTGLEIAPLVFGGNVFGWTADEQTSFKVLDAFVDHGFNAIDTADVYSAWVDGNKGGESETILGKWLKANPAKRDKVAIFTKVGSDMGEPGHKGLSSSWISQAADASLKRLQTDHIDLYFSHWPDADTPYEETLGAYQQLLDAGKIKSVGASNLDAAQLQEALSVAKTKNLPRYDVLQPEYNLYDRSAFDGPLRDLCMREGLGVVTYFSLASGFLSGKYRSKDDLKKSKRGNAVEKYLDDRGQAILRALDQVSETHGAQPAEVALAWIIARPGVTAPIASATSVEQVESFAKAASLKLSEDDLAALDKAST
ncbi:aldo/keto reductase [Tianweitania sp. BSSL-BM11]|uniref:Aldo/keto reductase n=1 Tax=Tianweitania aestuarii TaxID=2814886 RepID=A0ABS5RPZ6_9HYPH|nr:aldo/keto reductase [Tianweitania aestuarii]MBS9719103.1 aldo/keto reductase [Tianweitania aestuarii]